MVEFQKVGNKLLLVQKNTNFRAVSTNPNEAASVADAFATSILWGFPIVEKNKNWVLVDASAFVLQDSHGVVRKLAARGQGQFKLDASRSAIFLKRTKNFPNNTELEASITFTSDKPGKFVQQAAINPNIISLRMHHSFVRLPEKGYQPRVFHPQSGYWPFTFEDYAQPINQPITQRFIVRHRLQKKQANATLSEAVTPIIYYLDSGVPEPIKTALLTGASWWNQAFESIGYKDAFQVKVLPDGIDPMDSRYNVIQWVHRATRGWSYGYGVTDPRTGEIIKGHVSLGSLRVRQDYLIAQGMLSRFSADNIFGQDQELMDLALARIRQLAAHEVGHTLGLSHNFAASSYARASVMDYPHPLFEIEQSATGKAIKISSENAYKENIGAWDKAVIEYGYQSFPDGEEATKLSQILTRNSAQAMLFISDPDSRQISDAQPQASLWDNGSDAINELERVIELRRLALEKFGYASLHSGRPYSDLLEILMPVYYFHRYQATAAAKWIGGVNYSYQMKEKPFQQWQNSVAEPKQQAKALAVLLKTLEPSFLMINDSILQLLLPKAYGYRLSRESLKGDTGTIFDKNKLAAASSSHSLSLLLNPSRLARLYQQGLPSKKSTKKNSAKITTLNISSITSALHKNIIAKKFQGYQADIHQTNVDLILSHYLNLLHGKNVPSYVKAQIYTALLDEKKYLKKQLKREKESSTYSGFYQYQLSRINLIEIKSLNTDQLIQLPKMPPGSPI